MTGYAVAALLAVGCCNPIEIAAAPAARPAAPRPPAPAQTGGVALPPTGPSKQLGRALAAVTRERLGTFRASAGLGAWAESESGAERVARSPGCRATAEESQGRVHVVFDPDAWRHNVGNGNGTGRAAMGSGSIYACMGAFDRIWHLDLLRRLEALAPGEQVTLMGERGARAVLRRTVSISGRRDRLAGEVEITPSSRTRAR